MSASHEKFYRYDSVRFSVVIDSETEIFGVSDAKLQCREFEVYSETPKGVWLSYCFSPSKDKWVSNSSRKRFAHRSKKEALVAYKKRKEAYVRHSKARLRRAEEDLRLCSEKSMALRSA